LRIYEKLGLDFSAVFLYIYQKEVEMEKTKMLEFENGIICRVYISHPCEAIINVHYWKDFGHELFLKDVIIHVKEYLPKNVFFRLRERVKEIVRNIEPAADMKNLRFIKVMRVTEEVFEERKQEIYI
jgi:hypothetical protein